MVSLAWLLTVRAAAIEGQPADPAVLIIGHPQPGRHSAPLSDLHLHPACLTGAESTEQHFNVAYVNITTAAVSVSMCATVDRGLL